MVVWKRALLVALCGISAQAQAQDHFPVMDWGPFIQTEAMNSVIEDIGRSEAKRAGLPYPGDRNVGQSPKSVRSTLSRGLADQVRGGGARATAVEGRYTPSSAARQRLAGIMGNAATKQDPAKGEEMRQLVIAGRAMREYQRIAPMLGFRANDAIDAYAFYLLAQWGVANDHRADVTRTQAAAVRRQAAIAYAGIADQLTTDALRQEFAEMLVIQGVILAGVHEAAVRSRDDKARTRYAALARRGGKNIFSMDPAQITLTDAGFRTK
ncbi:DUF6683 family protein [Allosphingosinicella deserti]|uniref:Uncharacterized protein n=1 Tax=Allosphingosinicella deserti TaxID=2116704 RepID=A0A2P7QFP5_9SPHN|nr:DUF6683 family protein [Sphingomonas deserti]PSJ36802.1 hypothetical protein C7I55_24115 [Sphingomonas deserti]